MLTEEQITKRCEEICAAAGYTFNIPVAINGRLKSTLGRVKSIRRPTGRLEPVIMEFSRSFLSLAKEEEIDEIIKHECAHYLVAVETHEAHGHDEKFQEMCDRISCSANKPVTKIEYMQKDDYFKYIVYCEDCKKAVGWYHRMGKVLKNLDQCYCKDCGNYHLKMIQNW